MTITMTSLAAAIRTFATRSEFTTAGVLHSFGLQNLGTLSSDDDSPPKIPPEFLTCAIVMPESAERGHWATAAAMGNAGKIAVTMSQLFVVAPAEEPLYRARPKMVAVLDAVIAALKAQPFMSDPAAPAMHRAAEMEWSMGIVNLGGLGMEDKDYHTVLCNYSTEYVP